MAISNGFENPQTNMDGGQGDLAARLPEGFEHNVGRRGREEEHESRSGSDNMDGGSGDDQDAADNPPRKKRYHRHTPQQIQELEAYGSFFFFPPSFIINPFCNLLFWGCFVLLVSLKSALILMRSNGSS